MISLQEKQNLIQKAEDVVQNSYSPYSKFKVGAAVLTESGNVYTGTNVENASYGLTVCAERNAICAAVAQEGPGLRLKAIVITSLPKAHLTSPCGACRQVISEFGDNISITFPNAGSYVDLFLGDLLPHGFVFSRD